MMISVDYCINMYKVPIYVGVVFHYLLICYSEQIVVPLRADPDLAHTSS